MRLISVFLTGFIIATSIVAISDSQTQQIVDKREREEARAIIKQIAEEEIELAREYGPNKPRYILRGTAQLRGQEVLDMMTELHGLPKYRLAGIRFQPLIANQDSIPAATMTYVRDDYHILRINEILFLRNYADYIEWVIPHEVAHLMVYLIYGSGFESHGTKWQLIMVDMGFEDPTKLIEHHFDTTPVTNYRNRARVALGNADLPVDLVDEITLP